jgi:hypothetical protein
MLDEEFKKQRARTVRDLAEEANAPFIKGRLPDLATRYEDGVNSLVIGTRFKMSELGAARCRSLAGIDWHYCRG